MKYTLFFEPKSSATTQIVLWKAPESNDSLSQSQRDYIESQLKEEDFFHFDALGTHYLFLNPTKEAPEYFRLLGNKCQVEATGHKSTSVIFSAADLDPASKVALLEGYLLSTYSFTTHLSKEEDPEQEIYVDPGFLSEGDVTLLDKLIEGVFHARDLVNEPANHLTATQFATRMQAMGEAAGVQTTVLEMAQIESLKMGGLLAVNRGSTAPPTFTVMEHKPEGAFNSEPLVLIGKGVVYDTGGHSLKPTPNSMDIMKCDMAGGAAVAGAMYAVGINNLPYWVIGIVPATDNRISADAVSPGDIITMHSGKTVEVMNTDAEGRLLLADALSYAKKYKPSLVIDLATLTGASLHAIGHHGCVFMGTAADETKKQLQIAANTVHERMVEFPFWEDYDKELKSVHADIKNIGSPLAGAITAGKFLAHFIDYEWLHLDIAGPAFLNQAQDYRGVQGTGYGVRLIYKFIEGLLERDGERA